MSNNYPLVSVVIPSYNHEKFVHNCLDSVLNEDYPNKEIVIINDGSRDKTAQVIKDWIEKNGDKIPVKFINRENVGLCKTINQLLEMADGEYIVALASDDELKNNGILKRYAYLQENPGKKAVISDCIVIDDRGNIIYNSLLTDYSGADKKNYRTDEGLKHEIITDFRLLGPILMAKKDVFDEVGYFDETISQEDRDFYLKLVSRNLLGFLDETVAGYRIHGHNTSRTSSLIRVQADTPKVLMKYFNTFKEYRGHIIKEIIYVNIHVIYLRLKYFLEEKLGQDKSSPIFRLLYGMKDVINHTICFLFRRKL